MAVGMSFGQLALGGTVVTFTGATGQPPNYSESGFTFTSMQQHLHFDGYGTGSLYNHSACCSTPYRITAAAGTFTLSEIDIVANTDGFDFVDNLGRTAAVPAGVVGVHNFGSTFAGATWVEWNENSADSAITSATFDLSGAYCTAGTTTHGCVPQISGTGTPSASGATSFSVRVDNVEGFKQGLIFYGLDNTGFTPLPWGTSSSFMCVKSPVQRSPVQNTGGIFNYCNGVLQLDWNAFCAATPGALGAPFGSGQHIYAQGWFRDPPSPKTTMLSDALEFVIQP